MTSPGWRRLVIAALTTLLVVGGLVAAIVFAATRPAHRGGTAPSTSPSALQQTSTHQPPPSAGPQPPATPSGDPTPTAEQAPTPVLTCDGINLVSPGRPGLVAELERLAAGHGVTMEAAWFDPSAGIVTVGGLNDQAAWSTSKVPLALAVIKAGHGEAMASQISAALRQSDNAAAQELWWALGADEETRALAVTDVLRDAGDDVTTVPGVQLRPPYSTFGQTQWSTAAQVGFAGRLPCLSGAEQVVDDMANVSANQSWGLGRLPGAAFKGGWGPNPDGYLVRQFGWFEPDGGSRVLVAVAVQSDSFESGVVALDAMADALIG